MEVVTEELGDLPLLGFVLKSSPLISCLDAHFPVHGNWKGPSVGKLVCGWLMYIISENDHRLSPIQDWAARHLNTLRCILEYSNLTALDFQDDRLGNLLERFGQDDNYLPFQADYTGRLVRLYCLEQSTVRVDSVNVPSYRDVGGLFQYGYHKSHQTDEPFMKTMLATLDPLALPIASYEVGGNQNDDDLYILTIQRARQSLVPSGLLYVGDSKMASLENCHYLASTGNHYLCPLNLAHYPGEELRKGVEQAMSNGADIKNVYQEGKTPTLVAKVYELPQRTRLAVNKTFEWSERMVLVLSIPYAESKVAALEQRLDKSGKELLERFIPRKARQIWKSGKQTDARAFVDRVLDRHRVRHLLDVEIIVPPAADAPLSIRLNFNKDAIKAEKDLMGWRLYITNVGVEKLSSTDLLLCYREEYKIEQQFHNLLTKTTALLPIYIKDQVRIVALLRLLFLALQFVALIQYQARKQLKEQNRTLQYLVPGNASRKVEQPTTAILLRRFKAVSVVWIQETLQPRKTVITRLEQIHSDILWLLDCPDDLYTRFGCDFQFVNELA
jgi:transposase